MEQEYNHRIRYDFLDNLRSLMIFFVVMLHSGLVYEKSIFSSFIWIVYDPATNPVVPEIRIVLDIFVMSVIFFISGFLTPLSLNHKTRWQFLRKKLQRLIIPWVIAVVTLLPLYKWIFLASRDLPQQPWTTYFHWSNRIWGQNWLWFLPVLFLFDLLYLGISRVQWPKLTLKQAAGAVFLAGFAYSVCMDFFHLQGWTKTPVLDFQNERLFIYFLMFLLGARCFHLRCFDTVPDHRKTGWIIAGIVWIPVFLYRFFLLHTETVISGSADTLLLWLNFHLALFGILFLLLAGFRTWLNFQGQFMSVLNRNAYGVYIIHTVVMGGLAMIMLHLHWPSLVKFLCLTFAAFALSNGLIFTNNRLIRRRS